MSLTVGLAGAGLIGRQHIDAAARTGGRVSIGAVFDPAVDVADLEAVGDFSALLKRCDAVLLAVPNALHAPLALEAIAAGKPVLIEKPIADTPDAGQAIAAAAEQAGIPVLVGHHRRQNPIVQKAAEIVGAGHLGRLTTCQVTTWLPKAASYFQEAWRRGPGAGPLFINLIHDIDLIQHFCGPIVAVQAIESRAIRGAEVEESVVATLRFASGMLGSVSLSDTTCGPFSWEMTAGENPAYPQTDQSAYTLGGTHGSLSIPDLTLWHQDRPDWWAPMGRQRLSVPKGDALANQLLHFADVVQEGAPPLVSAQDGLAALRVVAAIKQACATGRLIEIAPQV